LVIGCHQSHAAGHELAAVRRQVVGRCREGAQRSAWPADPCAHAYTGLVAAAAVCGTTANPETATSWPVRVREW
jgi:hypothetical protein